MFFSGNTESLKFENGPFFHCFKNDTNFRNPYLEHKIINEKKTNYKYQNYPKSKNLLRSKKITSIYWYILVLL